MGAHIVERGQALGGDGAGDLPLHTPLQPQISASSGKAATAAIGSSGEPTLIGLAEDQRVAHLARIGLRFSMS
jgi:hypothetical protein